MLFRKMAAIALAVLLCASASGCSVIGLDAQSLMHTPRPTGEKAGIHAELEKQAGAGVTLRYPARGDYRSAIITKEVAEGRDVAIAFYQKKGESAGTSVMFIEKQGAEWQAAASFTNPANLVDEVYFGDVNGDGVDEAVVGWGSSQNNSTAISVYYFGEKTVTETKLEQSYSEMAVLDFDDDGSAELFTANLTVGDQPAVARLMRVRENGAEIIGKADLDPGVTKYTSFLGGYINDQQYGVVLDGQKSADTVVTELLYWDKAAGVLRSPFYDPAVQAENVTRRSTGTVSRDINGDKIIEIPIVTLLPGYTPDTAADETSYLTNWYRYDTRQNTGLIRVQSVIMNYRDGYWLLVPDTRRGKVTACMDSGSHTLTLYEWISTDRTGASGELGEALLRIRMFAQRDWDESKYPSYTVVQENNSLVYAAEFPTPSHPLSLSIHDLKDGFRLINQDGY